MFIVPPLIILMMELLLLISQNIDLRSNYILGRLIMVITERMQVKMKNSLPRAMEYSIMRCC